MNARRMTADMCCNESLGLGVGITKNRSTDLTDVLLLSRIETRPYPAMLLE
jgi:hypothetical protein